MSITSVTGKIAPEDLGVTLTHEHLHMQFDCTFQTPPARLASIYPTGKDAFQLKNLGLLRQYPYSLSYNLKMDDADTKDVILDEILRFKNLGGRTIVENTVEGISRNIKLLKTLSVESGVNVISGTGFYVACSQPQSNLKLTEEQMHDFMLNELTVGSEDGIKCGIIGEIGCSWPHEDFEKRAIRAAARVQESTNIPVTFHPGRNPESPFEIIRIFTEAGGKAEDVVMSHLDRTIQDEGTLLEFAKLKTFTQYDLFGIEISYYQTMESIDMPSDAQRIDKLRLLADNGHLSQIMMSHDIHTKHRLVNYGGHGFGYILQDIVPRMLKKGFSQEDIDIITVQNPKRWLARSNL